MSDNTDEVYRLSRHIVELQKELCRSERERRRILDASTQEEPDPIELLRALCKKEMTPLEAAKLLRTHPGTLIAILTAIQEDCWCAGHVVYPRRSQNTRKIASGCAECNLPITGEHAIQHEGRILCMRCSGIALGKGKEE